MIRKLGTGKTTDEVGARKWATGVKQQVSNATQQKSINARYMPLSQITLDPNNPRQLDVTPEIVSKISVLAPIQPTWMQSSSTHDWWDDYSATIANHLSGKAYTDYLNLMLLALSIKKYDRMVNPITVYAQGSSSKLTLIAGERRYLAHIILGEEVIATRILSQQPDDFEKDILQWEENNQRLSLSLYERLVNLQRLLESWEQQYSAKLSVSQMVSLAGLPRVTAHRYLVVIRCQNKLLIESIKSGQISSLRKAARLATLSTDELEVALKTKKKVPKSQSMFFKIKRVNNYASVQAILKAATEALGDDKLIQAIHDKPLDTAEEIAEAFDTLAVHITEQQKPEKMT